uniref:Homeobox and leucine zipper encoding n=1 Tax=Pelusios castaneus TaxID=367368 RepID=A0A8C8RVW1_9SAUR
MAGPVLPLRPPGRGLQSQPAPPRPPARAGGANQRQPGGNRDGAGPAPAAPQGGSQGSQGDVALRIWGSEPITAAILVGWTTLGPQDQGSPVVGPAMPPNKESPGRLGSPAALICLPPISEDPQLVWTQASQTSDLDGHQPLRQAFNYFPYPSLADLALLCLRHGLQLEKVKAWFMAQRLRCGISWSSEEIEETRARLACHQDRPAFGALLAPGGPLAPTGKAPGGRDAPMAAHHQGRVRESLGSCSAVAWGPPETREPGRASSASHHQAKESPTTLHSLFPTPPPPLRAWADPPAGAGLSNTAWDLSRPCRLAVGESGRPLETTPPSAMASINGADPWAQPVPPQAQRQQKSRRKSKEQLAVLKSFFLQCQWARREDYQWLQEITGLPRAEIIQWFGDTRYALKHGHLRWFWDNTVPAAAPAPGPCMDTGPLQRYWAAHQQLREDDLPALCSQPGQIILRTWNDQNRILQG